MKKLKITLSDEKGKELASLQYGVRGFAVNCSAMNYLVQDVEKEVGKILARDFRLYPVQEIGESMRSKAKREGMK